MDGNVREQIKVLSQRSNNLSNIVATSGLYPYQADVALRMLYTPSLTYGLPAISIDEPVLNKIQHKAIESFLPALGYVIELSLMQLFSVHLNTVAWEFLINIQKCI
jgi:hypothetical protein